MTVYPQVNSLTSSGIKILLIDDGGCSLTHIHHLLSESDLPKFSLDCVTSLVTAANKFRGNGHDVCIVDTSRNVRADYLAQLRRVDSQMPAIVITSDQGEEVVEAFRLGAADCLLRHELESAKLEQVICRVIQDALLVNNRIDNEQRYFGLIENAKDIIYTHDLAGNYLTANKAASLLTGYSLDEILKLNARQVVAPEHLTLTREMVERKLDTQQETFYEINTLTKAGARVPVEVNTHLIYKSGIPVAVQGIARDVTERRAVEQALRDSEERYRALIENANDIVYVHDLQGNFLTLNKTCERITGYSREEALQMNVAEVIIPAHLKNARRMMAQKTQTEGSRIYALDIITKSGRCVSLEVSARLMYDDDGEPVAIQGIGRDITERKRSELERRVILEIIQGVTLTSNLDDLLRMVHQALSNILYAENCFVALFEKETGLFSRPFYVDRHSEATPPDKMTRGVTAYVFRTGEPLLLNSEVFNELRDSGEVESVGRLAPSWLGVPLKTPTETIGVLVVQHYEMENAYTDSDLEFLNSVGGQIALAIERKRSEEALKRSEEEYRDIFDNATMGIYRSTRDGKLIAANRAFAQILGYSSVAEVLNQNLEADVYYEPTERDRLIIERMPSGSTQGLEVLWKKKDGSPIWVQLNAIAVMENGEPVLFDGFIHEITQRKQAEVALRESEERYQRLVELSPDGILIHTDGVISFVNSSAVNLMAAPSSASVLGKSIYGFIDESQRPLFRERVSRLQLGETLPAVEVIGKRLDGTNIECEVMSVPFTTDEKPAVQVVVRDITQRKQNEVALDEANKRALADYERLVERIAALGQSLGTARVLKSILRAVRDFATASVPCDGMLISLYDADEKVRRGVYCWVDEQELESENMAFPVGNGITGRAIKSGSIVVENDYLKFLESSRSTLIGDCSENLPRSALSAPMVIMGRTVGCIEIQSYVANAYTREHQSAMAMAASLAANAVENVALMDSEQEKADQLRQSQKMEAVGQLAGGVAHDFNNLLTAISGYSDLGLRKTPEGHPLRRNLEEIKKASVRASSLTRQLLAFSRKQMLQAKVIDLNAIVGDMDRMLRRLIGEDLDLVTALEPSTCQIKADPGQIEQVILNLAVNARDAMPRGGKITIETSRVYLDGNYSRDHVAVKAGYYIMLAVSDNGVGMDQDTQKRVFEPFFTTKEVGKGTGLGLSTVYGIVKQSGGNIWVYSELGKGSTFKVYLPSISESPEAENKTNNSETLRGQETILLVEDEEMVRNLSQEILEMNGYRVLPASNGAEALRICEDYLGEIQVMVTDVVMPQMSGRELSERVLEKRANLRVLFMSGYTDDAIVRHGVLDDGMPFLQKPFTPDALARKVRELVEQSLTVTT